MEKQSETVVVLENLKLTGALSLQEIAVLDRGFTCDVNPDGSLVLPKDHYGIYTRVVLHCQNSGQQYLSDYSGTAFCSLEDFAKFLVAVKD